MPATLEMLTIAPCPRARIVRPAVPPRIRTARSHHVDRVLVGTEVVGREPDADAEPGVVHQHVDRAGVVGQPGRHPRDVRAHAEVRREHLHVDAVRGPEAGRELLQPDGVAGDQRQIVTARGQRLRESCADARTSAGDQCSRHGIHATEARLQ